VDSLVSAVVRFAYHRRRLVLGVVLAALFIALDGARRLSFDSDVLSLLPHNSRVIQSFRDFLARFGSLDQLYVVFTAPEGHAISEYDDEIGAWVDRLRAAPEIGRVDAGVVDRTRDFSWMADHQLLVLRGRSLDEALRRLRGEGLMDAVAARRELLTVPSPDVAALITQDPAGLLDIVNESLGGTQSGLGMGVGTDGYVTHDGHSRLVIARPRRPPFDAEFSRALDARLREIDTSIRGGAAQSRESADDERRPPLRVEFAGGHRIAVETEAFVRRESIMNTVGSLALILPLLFLAFRSIWLVVVGPLPSGLALVSVLGALGFMSAKLSAAATGAAAMLFGLGVDGVVLLYVADRFARADDPTTDVPTAIAGPSSSMLLGMWTTAATFYGLMFVDFPSLQQLGRLIGHSMVACGLLTLVMVPALLPRRAPRRRIRSLLMPGLSGWIHRHRRAVLVASVVLTCVLGACASRLRINPTLERLRSVTDAARLETTIASAFGLPRDVYVVLAEGPELEPLLDTTERLAQRLSAELPQLAFQPPTRLLPSAAAQARAAARIRESHLSPASVRADLERARVAAGFTARAFDPFSARLPQLFDPAARLTYDGYVSHGLADLIDRFVVHDRDRWVLATYVFPGSAEQSSHVQTIVDAIDPAQTLTGLPLVNRELARTFLPQFIKGLTIGTMIVVALVVAAFRDWRLSVFALLPTAVGLIWTAGALALAGVELDLFAVFAVVTFVGIGVDYGIHLVHRYQHRGDAIQATAELAPVILIAAAITLLGYGTLVTSSYPPLRSIGVVSAVSVVALAATSVLMLPALLLTEQR
jgi:predicted RND superfamily exporter protein